MKTEIFISGKCKLYSLLLFSLFMITSLSGIAGATTNISIVPESEYVEEGQEFAVNIYLEPDRPVAGIQFDVMYDSDLINVVGVSEGDFLEQDGALVWFNPGNTNSSAGRIDSIYGLILDKTSVTGPGSVAVIQMSAGNLSGTTPISLFNVVASDTQGQIIPVDIANGSITISSDMTSSGRSTSGGEGDNGNYVTAGMTSTGSSYEEVETIERKSQSVYLGSGVSYQFDDPANPISYIEYDPLTNAGNVVATVEVLKQRSLLVSSTPPGTIYKNVNIWLGKPGYATEINMKDAVIGFSIDRSWLEDNRISDSSVLMYRYEQDTWIPLSTTKVNESSSYVEFETKTTAFSPFVIAGGVPEDVIVEAREAAASPEENESLDQNAAFILCLSMLILLFVRRR